MDRRLNNVCPYKHFAVNLKGFSMSTRSNNRTSRPETAVMVSLKTFEELLERASENQNDDGRLNRSRQLAQEVKDWLEIASEPRSYREIDEFYDQVSVELEHFANMKLETKEKEIDYIRLHMAREGLIQSALKLEINELEDIRNRLRLWYKIVVSESTDDDLLVTDQFIIAIHKYLSSAVSLSS